MIGYFYTIFLSILQGLPIVGDNDHEYYYHFDSYEFNRVLFLFRHI